MGAYVIPLWFYVDWDCFILIYLFFLEGGAKKFIVFRLFFLAVLI